MYIFKVHSIRNDIKHVTTVNFIVHLLLIIFIYEYLLKYTTLKYQYKSKIQHLNTNRIVLEKT